MADGAAATTSQSEQTTPQNPYEGLRVREVQPEESTLQTVKRNLTAEPDTSFKARGETTPQGVTPQVEGEQQYKENFGSPVEQFYGKIKRALDEHSHHLDESVLTPFRQGLDNMAADLKQAGSTGHTQTGAPLNPVTQGLATATGHALDMVPVGRTTGETAGMLVAPPEVQEMRPLEASAQTVKQLGEESAAQFAAKDAKGKIEHIGMVHKGEVVPGTGVHQVEHPDLPGKTFAIRESEMSSPEAMKAMADKKLEGLKSAPTSTELAARMKAENAGKTAGKAEKIESQQIKEGPNKAAWTKQNVDYELNRLREITRNPQATAEEKGIAQHQLDNLQQMKQGIVEKGAQGLGSSKKSTATFYHGTNDPESIRREGFKTGKEGSSPFLGDNYVDGVYLSKSKQPYSEGGQLEDASHVLSVATDAQNIRKVKGFRGLRDLYKEYNISETDSAARTKLTNALKKDGYEGLDSGQEVVVFDPKKVRPIKFGDDNQSRIVIEGIDEPAKKPAKRASDRPKQKNWPPRVTDDNSYDKNVYDPWAPGYTKKAGAREPIKTI